MSVNIVNSSEQLGARVRATESTIRTILEQHRRVSRKSRIVRIPNGLPGEAVLLIIIYSDTQPALIANIAAVIYKLVRRKSALWKKAASDWLKI